MNRDPEVDRFFAELRPPLAAVARTARAIVRKRAPALTERLCMGVPMWEGGARVCYIAEYRDHVNLGFFRGRELPDRSGILEGTGKSLRHVKLASVEAARAPAVGALIEAAARLDRSARRTSR
jgi:hypothetical protein